MSAIALGQAASSNAPDEIYGGIEICPEAVKAIALRVSQNPDESGFKLVYSDIIRLALWRTSGGAFAPQASAEAAQAVMTLLTRLRQQHQVPLERIYFIGSSRLAADHPADLINAIRKTAGLTLTFLDAPSEVQLSIAGTIPRIGKSGATAIDNRNTSVLIDIGSIGAQGGYELLKYSQSNSPVFDFVAMSLPQGAVSYANEISRTVGENSDLSTFSRQVRASGAISFRQALRREMESKPGMMHRKRVFLTGGIVWAMATLINPEDRQIFTPLTYEDIVQFADKAARSPKELINPNVSFIRDRKTRQEIEQEMDAIRNTFTPRQLIAGAELLKAAAEELKWQDKKIWFARLGHFGCILSYIRLQTGK
ncbi:MAG TPA: hypothetical protein VJ810_14910 [Blastocatellia bacterium]|nr:hypothetical protein [Blastocatellia bacterium]